MSQVKPPPPQKTQTSLTSRSIGKSTPALQNIPIPQVGKKRTRLPRDLIKQYVYTQAYGTSPRKLRGGRYAITCIDEAHVIVTCDNYNADDRDIYGDIASALGKVNGARVCAGYVDTSEACGHCPRSIRCLRGILPVIICPRCRRTNHGETLAARAYRKHEDYALLEDRGNMLAHRHDYVPTSCPLWLKGVPMVAKQPCPICHHRRRTNAIYTLEPREGHKDRLVLQRRLRRRRRPRLKEPSFADFLRSKHKTKKRKGNHETKHQQALRRPTHCAGARSVHKRQPQHRGG